MPATQCIRKTWVEKKIKYIIILCGQAKPGVDFFFTPPIALKLAVYQVYGLMRAYAKGFDSIRIRLWESSSWISRFSASSPALPCVRWQDRYESFLVINGYMSITEPQIYNNITLEQRTATFRPQHTVYILHSCEKHDGHDDQRALPMDQHACRLDKAHKNGGIRGE